MTKPSAAAPQNPARPASAPQAVPAQGRAPAQTQPSRAQPSPAQQQPAQKPPAQKPPAQKPPAQQQPQTKKPAPQEGKVQPVAVPQGAPKPKPAQPPQKAGKKDGPGKPKPPPPVVEVRPMAGPSRMRTRHWGLLASFALLVLLPFAAVSFYLWSVAVDQYGSTTGFTVRQEEGGGATDLLSGLGQLAGSSAGSDGDILYEFIQSQELVRAIDEELDLVGHYTIPYPADPAFALWPDAAIEDLLAYWERMVQISFDRSSGLIEVRVLAFTPDMAQSVAQAIVRRSQEMINALNAQARADATRYASADLEEALIRLKSAREALTQFRTVTQIVDPDADIQGRMGVMNNLQQQLAEALIEYDLLQETTTQGDPRLSREQRRIEVIRARIADERQSFATDTTETGAAGEDYPTLIAEFEALNVDREYAEETYRAALTALDAARANASRQRPVIWRTYITPTAPETAEYPRRLVLMGLAGLFLQLIWSIMALIYYSIRDRG